MSEIFPHDLGVVLWDIDGTLIRARNKQSESTHVKSIRKFGIEPRDLGTNLSGCTDYEVLETLIKHSQYNKDLILSQIYKELDKESGRPKKQKFYKLYPGVRNILKVVQNLGWRNGILTGNTKVRAIQKLNATKIVNLFDTKLVFTCQYGEYREDIGIRAKDYLEKKQFRRVVYVGDTPRDILVAKKSNFFIVSVCSGNFTESTLKKFCPDLIIRNLKLEQSNFTAFLKNKTN